MFEIELIIYRKMDLASNNLQRLICHKTQPTSNSQESDSERSRKVRRCKKSGVIERSSSPRSFPIVIIEKKNSLAVPLPLIDDILALLGKTAYFSTLDLRSGYWQVSLDEPGWEKTVFVWHLGLFNFRLMPFGLSYVPRVFTQLISFWVEFGVCHGVFERCCIFFSGTREEHFEHLLRAF